MASQQCFGGAEGSIAIVGLTPIQEGCAALRGKRWKQ